jgi:hypothetical protein
MSARSRWFLILAGSVVGLGMYACSASPDTDTEDDDGDGGSQGGQGGLGGAGGEGGTSPCSIDCSTIVTDACHVAECDESTGMCVVVNGEDGLECDDEKFCTIDDACVAGVCNGLPNDCGIDVTSCYSVSCDEGSMTCTQVPIPNGMPCSGADLCTIGGTCNNGLCVNGTYNDCFLAPVPNQCHNAVCNPATGECEAMPSAAADGDPCIDYDDLCSAGNTCAAGVCSGGAPKNCAHLTEGCFDGICNSASGQCEQMPIPAGGMCSAAADDCNVGICDVSGSCNPSAANEGGACDLNECHVGQTCAAGVCQGGTEIFACIDGDNCCPAACDYTNDDDCGCNYALISDETQFTDVAIQNLFTNNGHTFTVYSNNTAGTFTSDSVLLSGFETVVFHKHDRSITLAEFNALTAFVNGGGSLLVTGYDSLGSPSDTMLATLLNCSGPVDYTGVTALVVTDGTHPIALGPLQTFTVGQTLTASSSDHDDCNLGAGALQIVSVSAAPKLMVTDNVGAGGGKVIYWNGNGSGSGPLTDWNGTGGTQPALQNLFVNTLFHMCD